MNRLPSVLSKGQVIVIFTWKSIQFGYLLFLIEKLKFNSSSSEVDVIDFFGAFEDYEFPKKYRSDGNPDWKIFPIMVTYLSPFDWNFYNSRYHLN